MKTAQCSWSPSLFALALAISSVSAGLSRAGAQIVSALPANTVSAVGGGLAFDPILTPDGRFVVFASMSDNLVAATNGFPLPERSPARTQVFLRDRQTGTTTLISLNAVGGAPGNGDSFPGAISTNGQFVVFESDASDLIATDTNGVRDVFLRDTVNNTTALLSSTSANGSGNAASSAAAMTPDGRYVAFVSSANNLVANDTNNIPDIFVCDTSSRTITLASVGATAATASNSITIIPGSAEPALSSDGRYVVFYSSATNLFPHVAAPGQIYSRDLVAGTTAWVSPGSLAYGAVAPNFSISSDAQTVACQTTLGHPGGVVLRYNASSRLTDVIQTNNALVDGDDPDERPIDISADGRFVAFITTNTAGGSSAVLWDGNTASQTLVSGTNLSADCQLPRLDAAGRFVAFLSDDATLTSNSDGGYHIYLRDTSNGAIQLVDLNPSNNLPISSVTLPFNFAAAGNALAFTAMDGSLSSSPYKYDAFVRDLTANGAEVVSSSADSMASVTPLAASGVNTGTVSSNGQFVAFTSAFDPFQANSNGFNNVFLHDFVTGSNTLISISAAGDASGSSQSLSPSISPDGRWIAFASAATNLVPNDTNNAYDVFLRDTQSNTTTLVSVDLAGTGEGAKDSISPQVSADGRYVLFWSSASNLTTNTYNGLRAGPAPVWRDLRSGASCMFPTTNFAAMTSDGAKVFYQNVNDVMLFDAHTFASTTVASLGAVGKGVISPDGTRALLVQPSFINSPLTPKVYAVDVVAGTNLILGTVLTFQSFAQFTPDSRYVTYVAADAAKINQVYLYDFQTGSNLLVSQSYYGGGGNGPSDSPTVGGNRYVAYRSAASNLVPGDNNGIPDIFLYDRLSGNTTLVSVSQLGPFSADGRSLSPVFSSGGQMLVFQSWASDLAKGDFNGCSDVFALQLPTGSGGGSGTNTAPLLSASSISIPAGQFTTNSPLSLSWPAATGSGYQVQFKNSLDDPQWQVLTNPPTIVGGHGNVLDVTPDPTHRFYRIVSF